MRHSVSSVSSGRRRRGRVDAETHLILAALPFVGTAAPGRLFDRERAAVWPVVGLARSRRQWPPYRRHLHECPAARAEAGADATPPRCEPASLKRDVPQALAELARAEEARPRRLIALHDVVEVPRVLRVREPPVLVDAAGEDGARNLG